MRNLIHTILMSVVSTIVMAYSVTGRNVIEPTTIEPSRPLALKVPTTSIKAEKLEIKIKSHSKFLTDIGMRESSNNYKAVNQFGYLGKYQFGRSTLNNLGYSEVSNRDFLATPSIQENAMRDLLKHNKKILRRFIEKYDGKVINGIYITESGILAAAHLAGPGNVKKWLRRGKRFRDGLGTDLTEYLQLFGGYKIVI